MRKVNTLQESPNPNSTLSIYKPHIGCECSLSLNGQHRQRSGFPCKSDEQRGPMQREELHRGCKSLQIVGIVRKNGATNADEMLVCVQ